MQTYKFLKTKKEVLSAKLHLGVSKINTSLISGFRKINLHFYPVNKIFSFILSFEKYYNENKAVIFPYHLHSNNRIVHTGKGRNKLQQEQKPNNIC